jgi:hypothetical protein
MTQSSKARIEKEAAELSTAPSCAMVSLPVQTYLITFARRRWCELIRFGVENCVPVATGSREIPGISGFPENFWEVLASPGSLECLPESKSWAARPEGDAGAAT